MSQTVSLAPAAPARTPAHDGYATHYPPRPLVIPPLADAPAVARRGDQARITVRDHSWNMAAGEITAIFHDGPGRPVLYGIRLWVDGDGYGIDYGHPITVQRDEFELTGDRY